MQLKIQRSQRMGGLMANTVVFGLDVRADYSPEEQDNIRKYRLGSQIIYSSQAARRHYERAGAHFERTQHRGDLKDQFGGLAHGAFSMAMAKMSLNISIGSLGRGHHIECKDLAELLEAEETVRDACKDVTRYLEIASTFDGSEMVIEYDKGEECIHFTQNAPPLIEYQPEPRAPAGMPPSPPSSEALRELGRDVAKAWSRIKKDLRAAWTKARAYVAETDWNKEGPHIRAAEAAKARWHGVEEKLTTLAANQGLAISEVQVRAVCVSLILVLTAALIAYAAI